MNPPRVELEYAIRTCLKKLGVNTKIPKSAFTGKKRKSASENGETPKPVAEKKKAGQPARKRRKPRQRITEAAVVADAAEVVELV